MGGPGAAARWRLVLALPVPAASAAAIHAGLAPHREAFPAARWIEPERYHLTLRFLGATDPSLVEALEAALRDSAAATAPFEVTTGRGDGSRGRSEAAWLELGEGRASVVALADRLDAHLPPEATTRLPTSRPAPHLTIARRAPRELGEALRDERLGAVRVSWTADRVVLFRSWTGTPAGSTYRALAEARLAA